MPEAAATHNKNPPHQTHDTTMPASLIVRILRTQHRAINATPLTAPRDPIHTPTPPTREILMSYGGRHERVVNATNYRCSTHEHPPAPHSGTRNGLYMLLRKEVIQPHLPVRLPCYDLVPIASPTFDGSPPKRVRPPASGVTNFRDLTGGVYKARERIHRSVADLRLLATPTSWGRVADPNPN